MALGGLSDNQLSALQTALEEGVDRLSQSFPMSLAVVASRDPEGAIITLAGVLAPHLEGLVEERPPVSPAAFDWVQINRSVLTLALGARLRVSEIYQPLIELGLESGMVAPVFRDDSLLGVLVIGSRHVGGYTPSEIKMTADLASSLAQHLVVARRSETPPRLSRELPHREETGEKPSIAEVEARLREVARTLVARSEGPSRRSPGAVQRGEAGPSSSIPVRQEPPQEPTPALEPSQDITLRADSLGRIRSWDPRAEKLLGWRSDEVVGRILTILLRDRPRNVLDIRLRDRLLAHGSFTGRAVAWTREGLPVVCKLSLSLVSDSPEGLAGFVGRLEPVASPSHLSREPLELSFAQTYDFSKPLS